MEKTPLAALGDKGITASFGVAELREDDCAESFFVRADQALLQAKELGRNCVAIGEVGVSGQTRVRLNELSSTGWKKAPNTVLVQGEFLCSSPEELLFQKIKGMIEEQKYRIQSVEPNHLIVQAEDQNAMLFRRKTDVRANLLVDIQLRPQIPDSEKKRGPATLTRLQITICPATRRNRRTEHLKGEAEFLLNEIRKFLMLDQSPDSVTPAATSSGR